MQNRFNPITSEEIYAELCDNIENLVFMPGARISENDLCKRFDTSRHIVRSALPRLRERGLVEVYPQRGTYVSLIDMELIDNILYLRESVEQEAISRLISRGNNEKLVAQMNENIALQEKALAEGKELHEFHAIDKKFHLEMLSAIGKGQVMDIVEEQYIHVRRWRNLELKRTERMAEIVEEHKKILKAIEDGDRATAHQLMHNHLNTVGRFEEIYKSAGSEYFVFTNDKNRADT